MIRNVYQKSIQPRRLSNINAGQQIVLMMLLEKQAPYFIRGAEARTNVLALIQAFLEGELNESDVLAACVKLVGAPRSFLEQSLTLVKDLESSTLNADNLAS